MKVVIQRVASSSVLIDNKIYNTINNGLMVLSCFTEGDTSEDIDYIVKKIVNLRIFDDEVGVMNKSILDVNGEILSISQFTLYAITKNGNRPSFIEAARPEEANKMYEYIVEKCKEKIVKVETGVFGAKMKVSLINDGPTTIIMEK